MSVLLHLNGAPGVGKSTIAERLVASLPGWLNCDIDILRTLVGCWEDDFAQGGAQIRPVAREMMAVQLGSGRGVVLPQLVMEDSELAQLKSLAHPERRDLHARLPGRARRGAGDRGPRHLRPVGQGGDRQGRGGDRQPPALAWLRADGR